jgi:GNAT superfamily N-acetyltransferase
VSTLTVRGAGPGDRDAIQAVTLAAYLEYAATIPAHWEGYRQSIVATLAAAVPGTQIVVLDDDRVVGAVLLYPAGASIEKPGGTTLTLTWPEVRLLAVAPSARGRGVGAALMNECIHRAWSAGATALTLHTTDLMQAAMRLYERLGFERAHDLDLEPAPGIIAKGYRLDLPL